MLHGVLTVVTALLTRGCPSSHRPPARGSLPGVGCTWPACTRSVCEGARTGTRLPSACQTTTLQCHGVDPVQQS